VIRPTVPSTFATAGVVAFVLSALGVITFIATSSYSDFFAPRMPPRVYDHAQLGRVIADLEASAVIPLGTAWESEALKSRPVSASFWFLPTNRAAVRRIAESAGVAFEYPMGQHGEILGSIVVRVPIDGRPQLLPRREELRKPALYASQRRPTS
jgi:hypothetical protein